MILMNGHEMLDDRTLRAWSYRAVFWIFLLIHLITVIPHFEWVFSWGRDRATDPRINEQKP